MSGRRLSPALVISLIALFVSLGGSGYAAVKLNGKNIKAGSIAGTALKDGTITARKIGNRTITGTKIRRDAIGGAELKETAVAKVPKAVSADTAAKAVTADTAANASALGGQPPAAFERAGRITVGTVPYPSAIGTRILSDPVTGADVQVGTAGGKFKIVNTSPSLTLTAVGLTAYSPAAPLEPKSARLDPGGNAIFDAQGTEGPPYLDLALTLEASTPAATRFSHLTCSKATNSTGTLSCIVVG